VQWHRQTRPAALPAIRAASLRCWLTRMAARRIVLPGKYRLLRVSDEPNAQDWAI
jgi:hypothetical protein